MAGYRFRIDLFIPEATYNAIPNAKKLDIRELKAKAIQQSFVKTR